jgi:hypothetical protein
LNGTWGEPVFETGSPVSGEKMFSYTKMLDEKYVPENCHIIAFAYKENDKTILQAESARIIK